MPQCTGKCELLCATLPAAAGGLTQAWSPGCRSPEDGARRSGHQNGHTRESRDEPAGTLPLLGSEDHGPLWFEGDCANCCADYMTECCCPVGAPGGSHSRHHADGASAQAGSGIAYGLNTNEHQGYDRRWGSKSSACSFGADASVQLARTQLHHA